MALINCWCQSIRVLLGSINRAERVNQWIESRNLILRRHRITSRCLLLFQMEFIYQIFVRIIWLTIFIFLFFLCILIGFLFNEHVQSQPRFVSLFDLYLRPIDIRLVLMLLFLCLFWGCSSSYHAKSSIRQSSWMIASILWTAFILQSSLDIRKFHAVLWRNHNFLGFSYYARIIPSNADPRWLLASLLLIRWFELCYLSLIRFLKGLLKFALLLCVLDNRF